MIINSKIRNGQIAIGFLLLSALTVILISGFISLAASFVQLSVRQLNKNQAFSIAEAGIEYYRWHLAHAPQDFQDGTGQVGPYTHNYYDKNGNAIGQFILSITPPSPGSTIVTIQSTGNVFADSSVKKIISVRMGIPSFAKYAWIMDSGYVAFGSTAEVFGVIHSNNGIRFDGLAHNIVESALVTSTDPDYGAVEWSVYTRSSPVDPTPPTPLSLRADVFTAGRNLGVPAVDFSGITSNLSDIKSAASSSGTYFASSSASGYELNLATSGIFSVYKVTAVVPRPNNCSSSSSGYQSGWGTWSVQSETLYATGTIPVNGDMFFEDNLWVKGQISGKRVTIGAGVFPDNPSTRANININSSTMYTTYDGTDAISLIAQNNINVGLRGDDNLRIDGALIAQNGRIGRYSYNSHCGNTTSRTLLTTDGILGTGGRPMFYYSSSDGYQSRVYNYDGNLLYAPPPSFPLTTDQYSLISWTEVQ